MQEDQETEVKNAPNTTRLVVIITAAVFLLAVLVFGFLRINKSIKATDPEIEDTIIVIKPHTTKPVIVLSADSMRAVVSDSLYRQYFVKDTLPQKYPPFLLEVFSGYKFNDYSYIQKLDLSDIDNALGPKEIDDKELILQLGHYYKGISFLLVNDTLQAITHLEWALHHAANEHQLVKARWYLAMAYLKQNNQDEAVALLEKVAQSNSIRYYVDKSRTLLQGLRNNAR